MQDSVRNSIFAIAKFGAKFAIFRCKIPIRYSEWHPVYRMAFGVRMREIWCKIQCEIPYLLSGWGHATISRRIWKSHVLKSNLFRKAFKNIWATNDFPFTRRVSPTSPFIKNIGSTYNFLLSHQIRNRTFGGIAEMLVFKNNIFWISSRNHYTT